MSLSSTLWDKTNSGQGNGCQNPRSLHGHWWAKDSSFSSCITCPGTKIAVCIIITEQAQCQETTNLMMWQWLNSTHTQLSLRKTNSLFFKCMKIRSRYKISQLFTDASIGMIDEISIMKVCRCSQKRNALFIKMRKIVDLTMSFHQCTVHTLVTKLTKLSTILKPIFMVLDQSKGNPHSESFPIVHMYYMYRYFTNRQRDHKWIQQYDLLERQCALTDGQILLCRGNRMGSLSSYVTWWGRFLKL